MQAVPDEYDKTVCELMFERRGQLTNKIPTEEEIPVVRSKKLQQVEVSYAHSICLQYTMHIKGTTA